jgi:aldehyde dehydrogenase (NAD+)
MSEPGGFVSRLFIDGAEREADGHRIYPNIGPATGEVIGYAADAAPPDMDAAIAAARRAFDQGQWARDADLRLHCLEQLRDGLRAERSRWRAVAMAEVGSPAGCIAGPQCDGPLAFLDFPIETLRAYRFERELPVSHMFGAASRRLVWKEPAGVVGAITPWNVPLQINLAKIFPALAAGCAVVLKAAPETPWTAALLGEIAARTDLPAGVLNIVTGADPGGLGEQLVTDPRVDMISFTGSTATGRRIMAAAAGTVKKLFLELGGKSANIVLDDADFAQAMPSAAFFVTYHAGQGCTTHSRLLAPRARYGEAVERLKAALESIPYGDPEDEGQFMGPLISARHRERVLDYVRLGAAEGARIVTGGGAPRRLERGFYVEPTLLDGVDNAMRVAREEIFGPVLVVIPHDGDDDAVRIANDSIYGLSGTVHSESPERALAVARRVRTGTFNINAGNFFGPDAPFGGYKQSGVGREMGVEGFEEYLQTKTIGLPA